MDKINLKEKELSSKITELYQLKSTLKENERIFAHLQERYGLLEKETGGYREQLDSKSKDNLSVSNFLMEENS